MYQIKQKQFLKTDLESCWSFFSSPSNLSEITPKKLGFVVLTEESSNMYPGLIISYRIKPLFNIPINWITEITHVEEGKYFVDEQRKGPYKMWHHEHHFKAVDGGVEMIDIVSYELPFGILGRLLHSIMIKKKLKDIFEYRFSITEKYFNS